MQYSTNWDKFINKIKQSPDEYEILSHFQQHPKACETVKDIAHFLRKPPDELETAILDLEQLGILHNYGPIWGTPSYAGKYTEFYSLNYDEQLESILKSVF